MNNMKKYPLYIIALLSCILFLSCDKTKHEDTWWFDNETENLFTNGLFVNYESTCRVITIGCNSDSWIATMNNNDNQNDSWITINKEEGNDGISYCSIKISENKGWNERCAYVKFTNGNDIRLLTIKQEAEKRVYIPYKLVQITREGGMVEVSFEANVNCECSISRIGWNPSWIKIVSHEKDGQTNKVVLKVDENLSLGRQAILDISIAETGTTEHITLQQEPRLFNENENINIYREGTLGTLLGSDIANCRNIRTLTLSGRLNVSDMICLYRLTNGPNSSIKNLNMFSCTTDASGNTILDEMFSNSNIERVNLPGDLKCIPYKAFYRCTSLDSINVEANIKKIDILAFAGCSSLKSISFDSYCQLAEIGMGAFNTKSVIEDLVLPTFNVKMPPSALYGCTIKRLHLTEEVPPILVGEGKGLQNTILYVPAESVELYKKAKFWRDFEEICPQQTY